MAECRGCGAKIVWGRDAKGTLIPLDPKPPTYVKQERLLETAGASNAIEVARSDAMVSHFATCPNANQFSKGRKPDGE